MQRRGCFQCYLGRDDSYTGYTPRPAITMERLIIEPLQIAQYTCNHPYLHQVMFHYNILQSNILAQKVSWIQPPSCGQKTKRCSSHGRRFVNVPLQGSGSRRVTGLGTVAASSTRSRRSGHLFDRSQVEIWPVFLGFPCSRSKKLLDT